jgi:hypothetical protein
MTEEERAAAIAQLNDYHRCRINGSWLLTPGVLALDAAKLASAIEEVCTFQAFDEGDDPYGERDFGAFEIGGARFIWKIDYYDLDLRNASPDPANETLTKRILTLMLAEEY